MPSSQIGLFNRQTKETYTRDKTAPWGWPQDTQSVVYDQPPTKVSPDVIHDVFSSAWQSQLAKYVAMPNNLPAWPRPKRAIRDASRGQGFAVDAEAVGRLVNPYAIRTFLRKTFNEFDPHRWGLIRAQVLRPAEKYSPDCKPSATT